MTRLALSASFAALLLVGTNASAQPAPGASPPAAAPAAPAATTVGANLNISPKRVILDRNRRSATVYVYNQGNAAGTFDIALVDRAMLPDGQIVAIADAKDGAKLVADKVKSAQSILQISPRRVVLNPGQGQTIRLRLASLPAEPAAEYRTHLTVTTIPPPNTGVTAEQAAGLGNNELRFQINSVFGLSIPAIVRAGDADVRAAIAKAHIEYADLSVDGQAAPRRTAIMVLELQRLGASSLFGNLEIRPSGQRRGDPIGIARGVGVYPEIDGRTVRIPMTRPPAAGEKLEITFTDDDSSPGKLLASQVL